MGRFWKFSGQNYLKLNLSRGHNYSSIPCETTKIAEKIAVFWPRVLGQPSTGRRKQNWGTYFFAQSDLKKFRPNPMAGCWDNWGFICHRVTELQSYRHPRVLSIRVGEIFLWEIVINSPTRFACRGIRLRWMQTRVHQKTYISKLKC